MSNSAQDTKPRFLVALSFPGEKREFIRKVAERLTGELGKKRVFYDEYYEAELARANLDTYLQDIYELKSALVVPFFCMDYEKKPWCCKVEWPAIRSALYFQNKSDDYLMIFRFDNTPIQGRLRNTGYIDIGNRSPQDIAGLILDRLKIMRIITLKEEGGINPPSSCIHNLPFGSIGGLLRGREEEIGELIKTEGPAAITQAIQGLGGIGKTRLAMEIGWRAVKDGNHGAVFFVSADSPESLQTNLAKLTEKLELPERKERDEAVQYEAVLHWMESHTNWLLIFDNADTEEAACKIRELLPRLSKGRIIITSRRRGWGADVRDIDLKVLDPRIAAGFLIDRTRNRPKTPDDESHALRFYLNSKNKPDMNIPIFSPLLETIPPSSS